MVWQAGRRVGWTVGRIDGFISFVVNVERIRQIKWNSFSIPVTGKTL